jgi:hypothetical protein
MVELILQNLIAFFRQITGYLCDLFFLGIEIDFEMLGGQNLPLKIGVGNFVFPKVVLGKSIRPEQG